MPYRFLLVPIVVITLLSSCAYQGVVVQKKYRPIPFPESLGVDGMYSFQLRDHGGEVHSQMVTGYVFSNYHVGDYFNDLEPAPVGPEKEVPAYRATPELQEPPNPTGPEPLRTRKPNDRPYHPVRTTSSHRATTRHGAKLTKSTATKHHRRHTNVATSHRKRHRAINA